MKKIIGRLNDWRHERRIQLLSAQCAHSMAMAGVYRDRCQNDWDALTQAIKQRSPEQIARMEKARGLGR